MSEINQDNDESKQSDSSEIIQLKNKILDFFYFSFLGIKMILLYNLHGKGIVWWNHYN